MKKKSLTLFIEPHTISALCNQKMHCRKKMLTVSLLMLFSLSLVCLFSPEVFVSASGESWLDGWSNRLFVSNTTNTQNMSWVSLARGYYDLSLSGLSNYPTFYHHQKVAMVGEKRYIIAGQGPMPRGYPQYPLIAFSADSNWRPEEELDDTLDTGPLTDDAYGDFYVYTAPNCASLSDIIIVCGNMGAMLGSDAFIGAFNTLTDSFEHMQIIPNAQAQYITAICYIPEINQFYITACNTYESSTMNNAVMLSTPENLFTPSSWTYVNTGLPYGINEHRTTYFTKNGCIYTAGSDSGYSQLCKTNLTTGELTTVSSLAATGGGYIASDSNYVYFSTIVDSTQWHFYKYDGVTVTDFYDVDMLNPGAPYEHHSNIFVVEDNLLILGNTLDTDQNSYFMLYNVTSNAVIENYVGGVYTHYTDNFVIKDGHRIVFGAEAASMSNAPTYVYILSPGLNYTTKSNGDDLRFTESDGVTPLSYRVVENNDKKITCAVETQNKNGFYLYWENPQASSQSDSNFNPYYLYDDFNDSSLNTTTWTKLLSGTLTEANGALTMTSIDEGFSGRAVFRSNLQFNSISTPIAMAINASIGSSNVVEFGTNWDGQFGGTHHRMINVYKGVAGTSIKTSIASTDEETVSLDTATGVAMSNFNVYTVTNNAGMLTMGVGNAINIACNSTQPDPRNTGYVGVAAREYNEEMGPIVLDSIAVYPMPNANMVFGGVAEAPITITSSNDLHSTISPWGTVLVIRGASQEFTYSCDEGYTLSVSVDGSPVFLETYPHSYTFNDVQESHTIAATSTIKTFNITPTHDEHSTITPNMVASVEYGGTQEFSFGATAGYHISQVLVNGTSVSTVSTYTFTNVHDNYEISVTAQENEAAPTPTTTPTTEPTTLPTPKPENLTAPILENPFLILTIIIGVTVLVLMLVWRETKPLNSAEHNILLRF